MNKQDAEKLGKMLPDIVRWRDEVFSKNNKDKTSLNAYMTIDGASSNFRFTTGTACYGSVGGYTLPTSKFIINWIAARNAMENWKCSHGDGFHVFTRQQLISYFSYLARKSPWAKAFADKHAGRMVDEEYAVMRADLPGNLVVGAMTAHRQAWEYSRIVHAWLTLRKLQPHVNPDFHFLLAHTITINKLPSREVTFRVTPMGTGHTPLNMYSMCMESAKNFIDHKLTKLRGSLLTEDRSYSGITIMFDPRSASAAYASVFYEELTKALDEAANNQVDISSTLFAWNNQFTNFNTGELKVYSLQEQLPVFEDFYDKHFGGKA